MKKIFVTLLILGAFASTQTVFAQETTSTTTEEATVTTVRETNAKNIPPQWNFKKDFNKEKLQRPNFKNGDRSNCPKFNKDVSNRPQRSEFSSENSKRPDFSKGNRKNYNCRKMRTDENSENTTNNENCKCTRRPHHMDRRNFELNSNSSDATNTNRPQRLEFKGKMERKEFMRSNDNKRLMKFEHLNKKTTETETTAE